VDYSDSITIAPLLPNSQPRNPVDEAILGLSNATVRQAKQAEQFERAYKESVTGQPSLGIDCKGSLLTAAATAFPSLCGSIESSTPWLSHSDDWSGPWKDAFGLAYKNHKPKTHSAVWNGRNVETVYDWRLGVPHLLHILSMRIQVIAAADQGLRQRPSPRFSGELLGYKVVLEEHVTAMAEGVQCARFFYDGSIYTSQFLHDHMPLAYWPTVLVACADLHSGVNRLRWVPLHDRTYSNDAIGSLDTSRYVAYHEAELRRAVTDALPFPEMQRMIRSLNALIFNSSKGFVDGSLVREAPREEVFIVQGGAKFHVPSWADFVAMGLDANAIRVVPEGTLDLLDVTPQDGTLLKEHSDPSVYVFRNGKKIHVPNEREFNRAKLDWNAIRTVPDGSTAWMPTGAWEWPVRVSKPDPTAAALIRRVLR
jgi:hypothetical protein